jgi:hypothetical protein
LPVADGTPLQLPGARYPLVVSAPGRAARPGSPVGSGLRAFLWLLRFVDGEQPPPTLISSRSGLPFKVDLHRVAGVGPHFVPMFAYVSVAAAMMARSRLAPGLQYLCDLNGLRSPAELPRKSGLPSAHPGGIHRFNNRLNRCADELLGHVVISCNPAFGVPPTAHAVQSTPPPAPPKASGKSA